MEMDYKKIFYFSISQTSFSTWTNLDENSCTVKQIFSFELSDTNFESVRDFLNVNHSKISISIAGIDAKSSGFKLDESFLYDNVEVRFEHILADMNYSLLFNNQESFEDFLKGCISVMTTGDIKKINNLISISITDTNNNFELKLIETITTLTREKKYLDTCILVIPNVLPFEYYQQYSKKILISFLNCISDRTFSRNEYLIKVGNVNTLRVSEELSLTHQGVKDLYSIITFVFGDENRYEDKLQILRKVMTDYFIKNSDLRETNWNEIFQILKDKYSLFIDKTIDKFLEIELELFEQLKKLFDDINKDIDIKIDELSKQLLTILATIISSFLLKINDEQRLLVLGLGILYSGMLLIMNKIKGFHFSSDIIKSRKSKIENSLKIIVSGERLEEFDFESKSGWDKLYLIETIQKFFLIAILAILILSFIIA